MGCGLLCPIVYACSPAHGVLVAGRAWLALLVWGMRSHGRTLILACGNHALYCGLCCPGCPEVLQPHGGLLHSYGRAAMLCEYCNSKAKGRLDHSNGVMQ